MESTKVVLIEIEGRMVDTRGWERRKYSTDPMLELDGKNKFWHFIAQGGEYNYQKCII